MILNSQPSPIPLATLTNRFYKFLSCTGAKSRSVNRLLDDLNELSCFINLCQTKKCRNSL